MELETRKAKVGGVVHATASVVLLVLATVAFVLCASMLFECISAMQLKDAATDNNQSLSAGLSLAFGIVFLIIFGIISAILSLISFFLSLTVARYREGGVKRYGVIATVVSALYFVVSVASPIVIAVLNNAAT